MRPDPGIAGKCAIVTGGSRGIGRAIALLLAAEGADVTFFYRGNAEAAEEVLAAGRAAGHKIAALQVDIRDSKACAAAVESHRRALRPDRHPRQQRRHDPRQPARRVRGRGRRGRARDQRHRRVQRHARRRALHDLAARRPHRQHQLGRGRQGRAGTDQLRGEQGRDQRLHPRRSPSSLRRARSTSIASRPA